MSRSSAQSVEDLLEHTGFVRNLARGALGRDDGSDDIAQDAWVTALEKGPRDPKAARSWFYRVVRNRIAGVKRREATNAKAVRRVASPAPVPPPHEILEREDTRRRMVAALLALDPMYREPLVLRYYEDLPPREIAKRLGIPVETVRTRLRRGVERLRVGLDADYGDRRAWSLAALPLLRLPASATRVAPWVSVGLPIAALASVVALTVGVVHWSDSAPKEVPTTDVAPQITSNREAMPVLHGPQQPKPDLEVPDAQPNTDARRIVITVRDYDHRPVANAHVRVGQVHNQGAREALSGTTDAAGQFSMPHIEAPDAALQLPTQKYLLWIEQPETREDLRDLRASDWRPATSDIVLARGYVIAGDVVDALGRALPGVGVVLRRNDDVRTARTDTHGSFRITGLPAGRWQTHVGAHALDPQVREATWHLDSGSRHARLEVPVAGEHAIVALDGFDPKKHAMTPMLVTELDPATGEALRTITQPFGAQNTMLLCGLRADRTYAFWWGPDASNQCAYATGVLAAQGRLDLRVKQGSFLWLRVPAPKGWSWPKISVSAPGIESPAYFHSEVEEDGKRLRIYGVGGLPKGAYEVRATGRDDLGGVVEAEMTARAGNDERNELTLAPK